MEKSHPYSYPCSGTGVRAMAREFDFYRKRKAKINHLELEYQLIERGLIEILEKGDRIEFQLTKKGLVQSLKDRILLEQNELFDDEYCLIIFDIPEDVRKTRDLFRKYLKKAGFVQIQKSIWGTRKAVTDEMRQLLDEIGIGEWAKVVEGKIL